MTDDERRRVFWSVLCLVALLVVASYIAGYGTGQLRLYHEIFLEDVELEIVPLDSLPERLNHNAPITRSAHARSD